MSSLEKNDGHNAMIQYNIITSEHGPDDYVNCTTKLRFELRDITVQTVEGAMVIPAFVAIGAPFAFHLAPDGQHYRVSDLANHRTLSIAFDTRQECEAAIALFCEAQEVAL